MREMNRIKVEDNRVANKATISVNVTGLTIEEVGKKFEFLSWFFNVLSGKIDALTYDDDDQIMIVVPRERVEIFFSHGLPFEDSNVEIQSFLDKYDSWIDDPEGRFSVCNFVSHWAANNNSFVFFVRAGLFHALRAGACFDDALSEIIKEYEEDREEAKKKLMETIKEIIEV